MGSLCFYLIPAGRGYGIAKVEVEAELIDCGGIG
jgi:hypothetical protein